MAEISCIACEEIRQTSPEFIVNGLTDDICTSLQNDTGLSPSNENDDCHDLHNLNDCLVGNYATEVEAYDVCDWKEFMRNFIPNLWTTIKGIICSICGMWTMLHKHDCQLQALMSGISFKIGEEDTDTSYVVAGKGVSFLEYSSEDAKHLADVNLTYIGGGLARVNGTLMFSKDDFVEANDGRCWCFDLDGENPTRRGNRKGNPMWNNTATVTVDGETYHPIKMMKNTGELIFEIRIKKSEYPALRTIFAGTAAPTGGGQYQINLNVGHEGDSMAGQDLNSPRHTVPEGWIYVQARMISIGYLIAEEGHHYSPRGFMGIRFNRDDIEC